MSDFGVRSNFGLEKFGLKNLTNVYWNYGPAELMEAAISTREGALSNDGALMVNTGQFTGRSPKDKFIVDYGDEDSRKIAWGKINQPISPAHFDGLLERMQRYLDGHAVYVQDLQVGAHRASRINVRVITEQAWHSLFTRNLLIRPEPGELPTFESYFTILQVPSFKADPVIDGTNSPTFIIVNYKRRIVLIGNTSYAGEIKKSVFSIFNALLPERNILPMHCSANIGSNGDTALFFGLSGTGKTTLSSDLSRSLIGDDEHAWGEDGVFNFEGGCYAKTINLNKELEPVIWDACHRFGTVLENVVFDPSSREIDFSDSSLTENTRAAYPIHFISNHVPTGLGGHPRNIFFLTADAYGVLPPLSKLTVDQTIYYFLSGYTSKLAGTEKGLGAEPEPTFSTCFGAPFLPLYPEVYARLLAEKVMAHQANVWLVNTGWTGGSFGVGKRIRLPYTRLMIQNVINGVLDNTTMRIDPVFHLAFPLECPGIPGELMNPSESWVDPAAYLSKAQTLAEYFRQNFRQYENAVTHQVVKAGPG
jgi:phosphoenolpyruvate carboxykinase (ATP)